jgi:hypothetical protein
MEFEKAVGILGKHPLAIRALSIVASQGPQHLSALASQLGVGKVSAHRVAKLLTSMNKGMPRGEGKWLTLIQNAKQINAAR